jgi:hypothetical protein
MTIRSTHPFLAGFVAALLVNLLGCGSKGEESASSSNRSAGGSSATNSASGSSLSSTVDVVQFHTNPSRDGVYVDTTMTLATAAGLTQEAAFAPTFTGAIYAQPLYVSNMPGTGGEAFIVATEGNHLTAVDAAGATIWDMAYDPPVTVSADNTWPPGCGNVKPLGISGTPYIDAASATIYFGEATLTADTPPQVKHVVYAVGLADGKVKTGWPIDVAAAVPGFAPTHENQRGALALVQGTLYVPYGGLDGDCTPYFGWVVGIDVANTSHVDAFSTGAMFPLASGTPSANAEQGGIWAVGGVVSDGTSLFVSTGNTGGYGNSTVWSGGEAILRFSAGPTYTDANANEFHPSTWATMDANDLDLGGANPVTFDMPSAPIPHLIAAVGKDGYLYLLNRDNLGGAGGELSSIAVATTTAGPTGALNGGPAVYTTATGTYVAYRINTGTGTGCPASETGNLGVALVMPTNPPTTQVKWCSTQTGLGSPMVTTGSGQTIVWDASNHLYGYDADMGTVIFSSDGVASAMQYFSSPIDANGKIAFAGANPPALYVFKP